MSLQSDKLAYWLLVWTHSGRDLEGWRALRVAMVDDTNFILKDIALQSTNLSAGSVGQGSAC